MKKPVERRKASGIVDYLALALTTFGVGYGPIAPGTWGSMVGVAIYVGVAKFVAFLAEYFWTSRAQPSSSPIIPIDFSTNVPDFLTRLLPLRSAALVYAGIALSLSVFCLIGIWASNRSIPLLGSEDPSEAVVDEVMGQLITFLFIPFILPWPFILAGFLLFRLFDIWKPFPIRDLEVLPGGLGICADDLVAGVYAGVCLSIGYAVYLAI
ncbi:MAG: phosphatidylglycerophosphatase A [Acidobacteriota bacterium]